LPFSDNEELLHEQFHYAYQVERAKFDEILLRHAVRLGVDVREEHRVAGVIHEAIAWAPTSNGSAPRTISPANGSATASCARIR